MALPGIICSSRFPIHGKINSRINYIFLSLVIDSETKQRASCYENDENLVDKYNLCSDKFLWNVILYQPVLVTNKIDMYD